jgi:hypothetical protein
MVKDVGWIKEHSDVSTESQVSLVETLRFFHPTELSW